MELLKKLVQSVLGLAVLAALVTALLMHEHQGLREAHGLIGFSVVLLTVVHVILAKLSPSKA